MNDPKQPQRLISLEEVKRLSRRAFCQTAGVGAAVIALPACFGDGSSRVGLGLLDDVDLGAGAPPPDLATHGNGPFDFATSHQPPPDLAGHHTTPPDLAHAQMKGNCPGGVFNTGMPPSQFALDTATYFNSQDSFVCRDNGGLFALTSICTHAGCTNSFRAGSNDFRCPCHGATFSFIGDATRAPAFSPLDHYALCIDNDGSVAFDTGTTVGQGTRLNV